MKQTGMRQVAVGQRLQVLGAKSVDECNAEQYGAHHIQQACRV
jgi:hypothetical protein